jgi:hypothetical protein
VAPLPQNSTARYFFDYVTGNAATSREHTAQMRCSNATSESAAQEGFWALLDAMGTARFGSGWRVIRVRYQPAGVDFSVPVALNATLASFIGTGGNISPPSEAIELTFQGRSFASGRRGDVSLYGTVGYSLTTNYRLTPGEATWVAAAVAVLNAAESDLWRAIDGSRLTWYPYANWNYNSYWERKLRS